MNCELRDRLGTIVLRALLSSALVVAGSGCSATDSGAWSMAPACTPATCSALGKSCGQWPDGCGGTISCGTCAAPKTCVNGTCTGGCTPKGCAALGKSCGQWPDGCGGTISCGTCTAPKTCVNGTCN